ncbi:4-hydroxy-tetrahydrodipicolinate synthase [Paenibacillus zeisoli]|uniref:4-hydroxy-tetrahydrodipicolinate synthase n=1 Tax=Paenibacillus zeisoli TaxID=2496267 RepID=A0A433XNV7_9BACL|nr:4-hydroxy-tetrahydrodipicolinate synthase [Paenibacillus zeisoli]RUT35755.1 4-hydroxy-tetrahydrodipicolinate synthase [Paenibacillus zeisoli]
MLNEQHVHGIFIPVITPFTHDNQLDIHSYRNYITHLATYDIQGLVINGTTGESPTVSWDEVKLMIQAAQDILANMHKNIPVIVGTGTNDTNLTVSRTESAAELGADAALVVTPYYSRPTQEGILEHFRRVSQVGIPVIVYEIPARTGTRILVDTLRRIMEIEEVIGLKDSSGGLDLLTTLKQYDTKPILCGEDAYFHAMLCKGAAGGMLASANIHTQHFIEVYQRFAAGDQNGSGGIFSMLESMIHLLFEEPVPAPLKWLLAQQGVIATEQVRLPLMPATDRLKQRLMDSISHLKLPI